MMFLLDIFTRLLILTAFIVGLVSFIKDVKSGELKGFFGDNEEDETEDLK